MKVLSYRYITPNENGEVTEIHNSGYMTSSYSELVKDYIKGLRLNGKVAFLYVAGVTLPASEIRNTEDSGKYRVPLDSSALVLRELSAYMMHKWIGMFTDKEHIVYANISANTCASSMFSLYEAEKLLNDGFDEVIVLGEEKTSYNTLRLFDEMGIDIKVGEGFACVHLGKADCPGNEDITDCKWSYEWNRNPFGTTATGYLSVFSECDIVKPHGTGTASNEDAESNITKDIPQLRYKELYGHTQGISGLLEICCVMDEKVQGDVLCVSSGLGGFYGSCIIHKG